jgi:drug/metabolite transporter (DMT)-like permease
MTLTVFAAVLFSAFFQGGWNFFAKKSLANAVALLTVGWLFSGLLLLPIALYLVPPSEWDSQWYKFFLGSGVVHAFYAAFLGWGYKIGEVSVVYPIARGLGIVGTSLLSIILGIHGFTLFGALGVLAVVLGTFLIGLKEFPNRDTRKAFLVAVLIALTVSFYTIVDSTGAKQIPPILYLTVMDICTAVIASPYLFLRLKPQVTAVLTRHKVEALLVGSAGSISYFIILWAYQVTPTSYVAALREFSVVIASGLGVFVLRERLYKRKVLAIASIVAGVILLKLA